MVDWEKRTITGLSGKIYKIEPERITTGRWPEFETQSLMLAFGSDFKTFYTSLIDIRKKLSEIKILGDVIGIDKKIENLLQGVSTYTERPEPKIIKFCSLFCNSEDEDTSQYNKNIAKEKYEDWKHIPIESFFLLASEVIPSFKETYRLHKAKEKETN